MIANKIVGVLRCLIGCFKRYLLLRMTTCHVCCEPEAAGDDEPRVSSATFEIKRQLVLCGGRRSKQGAMCGTTLAKRLGYVNLYLGFWYFGGKNPD